MSTATKNRLDRLMPGLTFDERLDGILAAYHQDRRADPWLFSTMPASDGRRRNEAADILNALYNRLGCVIDYLEACVTRLELRHRRAGPDRLPPVRRKQPRRDGANRRRPGAPTHLRAGAPLA